MIIKKLSKLTRHKKLLWASGVLVVLISTFTILEVTGVTHFISSPDNRTTEQINQDETNSNNKQDFINGKTNQNTNSTPAEPTVDDISLSTRRETDGTVTIITELKNYSDGTCNLTIKNGNDSHTLSAPVLYQASFSTCEGFNVPSNVVPHGTWQISLSVTSKGKVNTKTISVEVQ